MCIRDRGDSVKAAKVLKFVDKHIPEYNVPVSYQSGSLDEAQVYADLGMKKEAKNLIVKLFTNACQYLNWYLNLGQSDFQSSNRDCMMYLIIMQHCVQIAEKIDPAYYRKIYGVCSIYTGKFQQRGGDINVY